MEEELSTDQLIARGKEAFARNAHVAALVDLEEAARREPRFADVHNLIGLCLSMLGRAEEATEAYSRATDLNPDYVEAHINRALTLNDLGRFDEARDAFHRASEAESRGSDGPFASALAVELVKKHVELGDLYVQGRALDEAADQYRRAVEIRPHFVDVRNRLARTLLDAGDEEGALTELNGILDINPAFVDARTNLGLALFRRGDLDAAREEWKRCQTQQPENAQVASYLKMLGRRQEDSSASVD